MEKSCTLIVHFDKGTPALANEIKESLDENGVAAKIDALKKAIMLLLNGETIPHLFITIIRYVLPSEDHTIQKLLLLYLEIIDKTDSRGKVLRFLCQNLICQNLRNNLQHPNEYIRGVTLRFLCRLNQSEIVEPLIHSILSNLQFCPLIPFHSSSSSSPSAPASTSSPSSSSPSSSTSYSDSSSSSSCFRAKTSFSFSSTCSFDSSIIFIFESAISTLSPENQIDREFMQIDNVAFDRTEVQKRIKDEKDLLEDLQHWRHEADGKAEDLKIKFSRLCESANGELVEIEREMDLAKKDKDHYDGVMKNKVLPDIKDAEECYLNHMKTREVHFSLDVHVRFFTEKDG
ncbi:unnamed protein product [Lupinus luteus]|uniref:Clathrin/coatomer adaptor adaptin-like N-terminal domain-containing protein n=1 Tax=Lupinus luteus TaxID=3873 RepID=A0AAV1XP92_LUPLU